jgi:surfeit locus 1 family protein
MMSALRLTSAIIAALMGVAVTFQLGNWQLRRAAEKVAIEQVWDTAMHAAPAEIRTPSDFAAAAAHFPLHVRVRGFFEHGRTIWLDNRALEGRAGFLVVTPLRVQGAQQRILVNRGWAPRDPADRTHLPPIGRPDGEVEIEGMAVAGVPRVFQIGKGDTGLIRQNLDLDAASGELGVPVAHFVLQQTSYLDDSLDRNWVAPSFGMDRHRGYAFQWFSLAALLAVGVLGLGWRLWRKHSGAPSAV